MSYQLKAAPAAQRERTLEACKFRERVPALEDPTSASVNLSRHGGDRRRSSFAEEAFVVSAGGKRYEGTRESVGTSASSASCYVALRMKAGVMTMTPLADWFAFRPAVTHSTKSLEEAEAVLEKTDRRSVLAEQKLEKIRRRGDADDEGGDDKKGGRGRRESGGGDGGGGGGGAGPDPDDDDFDDGAGPDWAAGEMRDEDGNEGLDMMDEELFDDDEDDSFEAVKAREQAYGWTSTDAMESSFNNELEARREAFEERHKRGQTFAAQQAEERGEKVDEDDEDDEEVGPPGGGAASAADGEWSKQMKAHLRDERKALRDRDYDSDEEDEDEFEDADAAWKEREAETSRRMDAEATASGGGVKTEAAEEKAKPAAGGKRTLSPAGEEKAKRAKQQQLEKVKDAAARGGGGGGGKVEERDIVMLLHQKGRMALKEIIQHFKAFISTKEEKTALIQILSRVAFTEEHEGRKIAKLKESTLVEYDLDDPNDPK